MPCHMSTRAPFAPPYPPSPPRTPFRSPAKRKPSTIVLVVENSRQAGCYCTRRSIASHLPDTIRCFTEQKTIIFLYRGAQARSRLRRSLQCGSTLRRETHTHITHNAHRPSSRKVLCSSTIEPTLKTPNHDRTATECTVTESPVPNEGRYRMHHDRNTWRPAVFPKPTTRKPYFFPRFHGATH